MCLRRRKVIRLHNGLPVTEGDPDNGPPYDHDLGEGRGENDI